MKLTRFQRPSLWNWSAFDDQLSTLRDDLNQLFGSPLVNTFTSRAGEFFNTWSPALDVFEDKDHLTVKLEAPGLKKEDFDISFQDGSLTISGERKSETQESDTETSRSERVFGRFHRTISIPKAVDGSNCKAVYKDGILTVKLPKKEEAKPKQIEVQIK